MIARRKIHMIKGEFVFAVKNFLKKNAVFPYSITEWEKTIASYIGIKHAAAVSSGRKGMEWILRALKLNNGDEIIIPAYTLKGLIGIIQFLGLVPVPADVDIRTFNIAPEAIAGKITGRTRVILAAHLFGTPCEIEEILRIAKSKEIFVVEDCAHSIGSESHNRKTGSFGDAAFFSFETIKPINTYGGGMVVTNNEGLDGKVREIANNYENEAVVPFKKIMMSFLENWLLPTPFSFPLLYLLASEQWSKKMYDLYRKTQKSVITINSFTDFQAFLGMEKLKTLGERISQRQKQADLLKSLLGSKIEPQYIKEGISPNYYFFVSRLASDIHKVRKSLLMRGIDAGVGAEIADDCGSILGSTDCPNTKEIFHQAIHLPLYESMTSKDIRYIAKILEEVL